MDVEVIEGDCLAIMGGMEAGSVDCVITDPPYNVGFIYSRYQDNRPDYAAWCAEWFAECRRVCSGPIAISCGVGNVGMWCRIAIPSWVACWWKPASMGRAPVGVNNWEPVLLYGDLVNRKVNDVIRAPIKPARDVSGHPCPKPREWALGLVAMLSEPGQIILDPFVGSGTTLVACRKAGRRGIGIEVDERYIPIIHRRLSAAATPLFDLAPKGG